MKKYKADVDGLTKIERYRLKDIDEYRKKKADYAKTPEERAKRTEYMRGWREKNRERNNEICRASQKRNAHKHVGKARIYNLRKYGITEIDYERMFQEQEGRCYICRTDRPSRFAHFHVDHCHTTGKVRGLLCARCNGGLGWLEKHRDVIEQYLNKGRQA